MSEINLLTVTSSKRLKLEDHKPVVWDFIKYERECTVNECKHPAIYAGNYCIHHKYPNTMGWNVNLEGAQNCSMLQCCGVAKFESHTHRYCSRHVDVGCIPIDILERCFVFGCPVLRQNNSDACAFHVRRKRGRPPKKNANTK